MLTGTPAARNRRAVEATVPERDSTPGLLAPGRRPAVPATDGGKSSTNCLQAPPKLPGKGFSPFSENLARFPATPGNCIQMTPPGRAVLAGRGHLRRIMSKRPDAPQFIPAPNPTAVRFVRGELRSQASKDRRRTFGIKLYEKGNCTQIATATGLVITSLLHERCMLSVGPSAGKVAFACHSSKCSPRVGIIKRRTTRC